jgi:hypothetical protein
VAALDSAIGGRLDVCSRGLNWNVLFSQGRSNPGELEPGTGYARMSALAVDLDLSAL